MQEELILRAPAQLEVQAVTPIPVRSFDRLEFTARFDLVVLEDTERFQPLHLFFPGVDLHTFQAFVRWMSSAAKVQQRTFGLRYLALPVLSLTSEVSFQELPGEEPGEVSRPSAVSTPAIPKEEDV